MSVAHQTTIVVSALLARGLGVAVCRGVQGSSAQGGELLDQDDVSAVVCCATGAATLAVDQLLDLFPQLRDRPGVRARALSGGEQQILATARAVLLGPDVVVMHEPTEGLAPAVVRLVGALVARLRDDGVSVLLMDQHGAFPPAVADEVVEMERGVIARQEAVA
jgi:ABC-type branched-subunit amino acid transport system ATPase component